MKSWVRLAGAMAFALGFASVQAVTKPESHNFMFFVAHGDGTHTFTRTLREHVNASRAFHRKMRERRRQEAGG